MHGWVQPWAWMKSCSSLRLWWEGSGWFHIRLYSLKTLWFYVQFLQEAGASERFSASQEIPVVLSDYPGIPRAQKWRGSHPRLWIPGKGNSLPVVSISFFVQSLAVKAMLQNTSLKDSYFAGTALITLIQGHFMLALLFPSNTWHVLCNLQNGCG